MLLRVWLFVIFLIFLKINENSTKPFKIQKQLFSLKNKHIILINWVIKLVYDFSKFYVYILCI